VSNLFKSNPTVINNSSGGLLKSQQRLNEVKRMENQ
jgi:hypothetical protein